MPTYNTVYRCLQPGRSRLDVELMVDIVHALTADDALARLWRRSYEAIRCQSSDAAIVSVATRLPDDLGAFVVRQAELARIRDGAADGQTVFALDGMAGVGKTRLAVRAAHELVAAAFGRDLQLAVDLRGYHIDRVPADSGAVLSEMLTTLGVRAEAIAGLAVEARAERFRVAMRGVPAILVLEDAANAGQVLPLLPGGPLCVVLVTSRRRLGGLPGVRIPIGMFAAEESHHLLQRTLGKTRVDAERDAAMRLATSVGHLPLALSLMANRARRHPDWTLSDHADRVEERRAAGRLEDSVEVALATSYEAMDTDHRAVLRGLSAHPGRDCDAYAVAAITGSTLTAARSRLAELAEANLVRLRADGRIELHDLVRIFATTRASDEDSARDRGSAGLALEDYYVAAAAGAMDAWAPAEHDRPSLAPSRWETPEFSSRAAALDWLDVERPNLIAVAVRSGRAGADRDAGSDVADGNRAVGGGTQAQGDQWVGGGPQPA